MSTPSREQQAAALTKEWAENARWKGIQKTHLGETATCD